jgi:BirA family biotin operon repressor/biotin-[acetyl-CoA-carboxylase] ligase
MKNWHHQNFIIHDYDKVDSTNNLAHQLAKSGNITHNHVILSKEQNAGKGRYGRVWESPIGNLYFSILLKPDKDIVSSTLLSFVAVTAMGIAINEISNNEIPVQYKWPNDILISGKKIAGLLLESDNWQGKSNFVIINSHP